MSRQVSSGILIKERKDERGTSASSEDIASSTRPAGCTLDACDATVTIGWASFVSSSISAETLVSPASATRLVAVAVVAGRESDGTRERVTLDVEDGIDGIEHAKSEVIDVAGSGMFLFVLFACVGSVVIAVPTMFIFVFVVPIASPLVTFALVCVAVATTDRAGMRIDEEDGTDAGRTLEEEKPTPTPTLLGGVETTLAGNGNKVGAGDTSVGDGDDDGFVTVLDESEGVDSTRRACVICVLVVVPAGAGATIVDAAAAAAATTVDAASTVVADAGTTVAGTVSFADETTVRAWIDV